ncbi:PepSY domain-containing protein [Schlegelella aquatica]|uniref:PepSY domain-containing protein n=1 Tax=Caldimonas aquatica TaxID=376175 RepID=UPI00374FDF30
MKRIVPTLAAATFALVAGAVFASDKCDAGPKDQWQPKEALEKKLQAEGIKVKRIKIDDGCYEVYGTDAKGERIERYFHPKTLESVKN